MQPKIVLILFFLGLVFTTLGQTDLTINGQELYIGPDAHITISGDIELIVGKIINEGTIYLKDDFNAEDNCCSGNGGKWIFNGSSPQDIDGDYTLVFNHFSIDKSYKDVKLKQDIKIKGELDIINGSLKLNDRYIDFDSTGSFSNLQTVESIQDNGTLRTLRHLDSPNNIHPGNLGISITSAYNLGLTEVIRHFDSTNLGVSQSINSIYEIHPTINSGLNATLRYYYNHDELNGIDETELGLFRSTDDGLSWEPRGGFSNPDSNFLELTEIDAFSWWTAGPLWGALALELTFFEIYLEDGNSALLNWGFEDFTSDVEFEISKSNDGYNFIKAGSVEASLALGTSHYFIDKNLEPGIWYFRIQLIKDGIPDEFSEIKSIQITNQISSLYPNPAAPGNTISITTETPYSNFKIYNLTGQNIYTIDFPISSSIKIQVPDISPGIYTWQLSERESTQKGKLEVISF